MERAALNCTAARALGTSYTGTGTDPARVSADGVTLALLVNPTPMAHLRAVSEQGGLMPAKSTYFHPKLATGLTLNPLA